MTHKIHFPVELAEELLALARKHHQADLICDLPTMEIDELFGVLHYLRRLDDEAREDT